MSSVKSATYLTKDSSVNLQFHRIYLLIKCLFILLQEKHQLDIRKHNTSAVPNYSPGPFVNHQLSEKNSPATRPSAIEASIACDSSECEKKQTEISELPSAALLETSSERNLLDKEPVWHNFDLSRKLKFVEDAIKKNIEGFGGVRTISDLERNVELSQFLFGNQEQIRPESVESETRTCKQNSALELSCFKLNQPQLELKDFVETCQRQQQLIDDLQRQVSVQAALLQEHEGPAGLSTGSDNYCLEADSERGKWLEMLELQRQMEQEIDSLKAELSEVKADNEEFRKKHALLVQDKVKMMKINSNLESNLRSVYRMVKGRNSVTDNDTVADSLQLKCANTLCAHQFSLDDKRHPCVQCGKICCIKCYNGLGERVFFCGNCRRILGQIEKHFASGATSRLLDEEFGADLSDIDSGRETLQSSVVKNCRPTKLAPRSGIEFDSPDIQSSISDENDPDDLRYEIACHVSKNTNHMILLRHRQTVYVIMQVFMPKTSCSWNFETPNVTKGVVVNFSILYSQTESEEEETLMPMKRLNFSKTSPISGNLVAKCCGSYIFKLTSYAGDAISVNYKGEIEVPQ